MHMKKDYRSIILSIRSDYLRGKMSIDKAQEICKPLIEEMNKKASVIAKKYGKRHVPFTFRYLFR